MRKVTLRNLLARKVRLLLSASAIVLGVAFVGGSLVFTDTIDSSFDGIVEGSINDAMVRQAGSGADGTTGGGFNLDARSIPASTVAELAARDGVARADGSVDGQGLFVVKKNGKLLGGTGAPTLAFNWTDAPNTLGEPVATITSGRAPQASGEVVLDERAADQAGYEVGDTVQMITAGEQPRVQAELVGLAEFAGGGLAGASLVFFDTATAQDVFLDGQDAFTSIALTADPGVTQAELVKAVEPALPDGLEAVTGDELTDEIEGLVGQLLGFLNTFLLVFAGIALVVGSFLIVNTFSILVAQRSRELALLRALGASRGQVSRSVLTEAAVVGLVGSTLGVAVGYGLAAALKALFGQFGLDLSGTALVLQPSTIVVSYVVGLLVTMVAAYLPARRASRIAPVAAMRDDVALPESSIRRRVVAGAVLAVVGAGLMASGLAGVASDHALQVGLGVLAVLLAIVLAGPALAQPVLAAFGVVYSRLYGTVGRLATQNSRRNPRRTAATSSALMIGMALVTTMSVLGASVNKSIDVGVDEQFTSDYLISNAVGQPFSPQIAEDVAQVDGVAVVSAQQTVTMKVDDSDTWATAAEAGPLDEIFDIVYSSGESAQRDGEIALNETKAGQLGVGVGDTVDVALGGREQPATVTGVYEDTYVIGTALVPLSTVVASQVQRTDSGVALDAEPGVDVEALGDRLEKATADFPTVTVQTKQDFAESQRAQVNTLLYLIYALLGLAIVIAILGIVNTLALSVIERTREVGLLRAVGVSRPQLRRMVRLESIAIAVLGALLGVAAGLVFGVVLRAAFEDDGLTDLAVPWLRLAVFVAVAALVGVLAAVLPARRAARLDVLTAISSA
ncbi:FtsX-like permease family protein [Aeromicrobium sp. IC_218]|uniref:ABC transporter permease n=1 Tax=Aeromicrobium sp. IC_218 TaxID=2545468 RepID=UPI00103BFBCE|nr:FtsX-like permease family protein [Aeromicrobium sp. IC_218]TCJ00589.1 FtsX-like permease family protein [Aeromicrobium sp. IC_218]